MYTPEDEALARRIWRRRLLISLAPAAAGLGLGVGLFVAGCALRSDTLWMATAALTVLGGGAFLFLFGVWARPALDYLRHVRRMLHGRRRETVGVMTRFAPELCERDGIWCHAMMVNLGSGEAEDDRLFYFDDEKPAPPMPVGTRVRVVSNDRMVCGIWEAQEEA